MKKILHSFLAGAALCSAVHAQNVGDTVTTEALKQLEWIQGSAPADWEPGKLYVLECWATWCGPCIANIPHVDALYDKFSDQGLRVIGIDVWEDGKDKVAEFVKKKGDGMSYPVAYTGKGGPFETKWLKPAGVMGIPHAFLVKDGKVIAMSHPAQLTEELITTLLKGGAEQDAILAKLNEAAAKQKVVAEAKGAWQVAYDKKDAAGMKAAVERFEAIDPGYIYLPAMRNDARIAAKDWAGIEKFLAEDSSQLKRMGLNSLTVSLVRRAGDDVPAEIYEKTAAAYDVELGNGKQPSPMDAVALSRLFWKAGNKEKAAARARQSVEWAAAPAPDYAKLPVAPFEKFSTAVAGGTMPSDDDFIGWVKEARAASAPAKGE